jgi:hypothetical protein
MGATHFLTKTVPKVVGEMALSVLAYNLTRVINIVGIQSLMAAIGPDTPRVWPFGRKLRSARYCTTRVTGRNAHIEQTSSAVP